MRSSLIAFSCAIALSACDLHREEVAARPGFGFVPRYLPADSAFLVDALPPRDLVDAGSFALLGDLLLIVDQGLGFHVLDNGDPTNPVGLAFVSVPGCTGVTARNNFAYVNNLTDLVTLDLTDPTQPSVVARVEDLYGPLPDFPARPLARFECVDPTRGVLIGWTEGGLGPGVALCQLN